MEFSWPGIVLCQCSRLWRANCNLLEIRCGVWAAPRLMWNAEIRSRHTKVQLYVIWCLRIGVVSRHDLRMWRDNWLGPHCEVIPPSADFLWAVAWSGIGFCNCGKLWWANCKFSGIWCGNLSSSSYVKCRNWKWRDYNIRYQRAGDTGPALVLIHGFGANWYRILQLNHLL